MQQVKEVARKWQDAAAGMQQQGRSRTKQQQDAA
jgi:hypothetical protein